MNGLHLKRIKPIFAIVLIFMGFFAKAQDPLFSQFYSAPLFINPALAGSASCGRISANYRNQWSSIPGAFNTIHASYDQHFDEISGGVGFTVTSDRQGGGSFSTTNIGAIYSYSLQVNDVFSIKAGLQASFVNRHIDWNELTFPDQFDPQLGLVRPNTGESLPNTPTSKNYADFSAGIVGYSEYFYAGIAVHHLGKPDEGFTEVQKLRMKYTVHAGAVIDLKKKWNRFRDPNAPTLSPNIIYQHHGTSQQLNYGLYANIHPVVFGAWLRQNITFKALESVIFLVGLQHNNLRIGYSYDLALNELYRVSGGAHEISFSVGLPCPEKKTKVKMINCPHF